ncbi:MAG: sigma-70 family RNA polymerase sigma factor [Pirellulales bacterium]|nr:sigma-70 family RNA polymerase sigma factor [Pirellulales bacterium]
MTAPDRDNADTGHFVDLFLVEQRSIYKYIVSLVGHAHDADDILQETSRVLWEKFDTFEQGTNFRAWAFRIAHNKVLDYRRRQGKKHQLLSDEVLGLIADTSERENPRLGLVKEALAFCVKRLKRDDQKLIQSRYQPDYDRTRIAKELGRPPNSISKSLARIRGALLVCIKSRIDGLEHKKLGD